MLARQLVQYTSRQGRIEDGLPLTEAADALRCGEKPIEPFHWEIEFPEVFGRENGGFDAIVGNPPFLGGKRISTNFGGEYLAWLLESHDEADGNADLIAHFFRRSFKLLRKHGCFGLIATNTIGQGDTRSGGLTWICRTTELFFSARKRIKWPGQAAVVVSTVHISKGNLTAPFYLDGKSVSKIYRVPFSYR